jgi:hypothetical protein
VVRVENNEQWKDIQGTDGFYQISSLGRVKSFINTRQNISETEKILKPYLNTKKYPCVSLFKKNYRIHRLVAEHFIPNPKDLPQVNHKDGNKTNNEIDNLEWVTNRENVIHFFKSQSPGVYQTPNGKFAVKIYINRKRKHIGTFETISDANIARQKFLKNNI